MSASKVIKKCPKPKFGETFLNGIVTVKIGPELKGYHVHKTLIMCHSEFFRAAFGSRNFKEGVSGEVTLEDVDHVVFEAFIDWIYSQELPEIKEYYDWGKYGGGNSDHDMYITQLYGLANRIIAPRLTSLVLKMAVDDFDLVSPDEDAVAWAFASLPENDVFLQVVVDSWCAEGRTLPGGFEGWDLPREFLRRVINKYAAKVRWPYGKLKLEDYLKSGNTSESS